LDLSSKSSASMKMHRWSYRVHVGANGNDGEI
jgi:hypothetical protein